MIKLTFRWPWSRTVTIVCNTERLINVVKGKLTGWQEIFIAIYKVRQNNIRRVWSKKIKRFATRRVSSIRVSTKSKMVQHVFLAHVLQQQSAQCCHWWSEDILQQYYWEKLYSSFGEFVLLALFPEQILWVSEMIVTLEHDMQHDPVQTTVEKTQPPNSFERRLSVEKNLLSRQGAAMAR